MRLYKGNAMVLGRSSQEKLYSEEDASMDSLDTFDPSETVCMLLYDVECFDADYVRSLVSLPSRPSASRSTASRWPSLARSSKLVAHGRRFRISFGDRVF